MWVTKSFRKIERDDIPKFAVFVFFCIGTQVPLYFAFNHAAIGAVQLVFYATFLIACYIVGKFYLGEQLTRYKLLSLILAFAGLVIVFGVASLAFAPLGLSLALLNGVNSGVETASSKKLTTKYPAVLVIFWGWVFTFLTHLPISLAIHEKQVPIHLDKAWLFLVIYSVVNALAFWISIAGFKHVDASIGGLIGLTEIIFSVIFGAVIFHEKLSVSIYFGGAIILLAATLPDLAALVENHHGRPKPDSVVPL